MVVLSADTPWATVASVAPWPSAQLAQIKAWLAAGAPDN